MLGNLPKELLKDWKWLGTLETAKSTSNQESNLPNFVFYAFSDSPC